MTSGKKSTRAEIDRYDSINTEELYVSKLRKKHTQEIFITYILYIKSSYKSITKRTTIHKANANSHTRENQQ